MREGSVKVGLGWSVESFLQRCSGMADSGGGTQNCTRKESILTEEVLEPTNVERRVKSISHAASYSRRRRATNIEAAMEGRVTSHMLRPPRCLCADI